MSDPLAFEACTLPGDGLMLRADAIGPADGLPVLFFHGGGQSRRAWRGAARKVAEAGARAYTVDLRGHGESDWSATGQYDVRDYGRDVACLVDHLARPMVLVGASRGGQAALLGAAARPDQVLLLLLADVAPVIEHQGVDGVRAFMAASQRGFASLDDAADALARLLDRPRMADASGLGSAMRPGDDGRLYWRWDPKTGAPEFLYPPSESQALIDAATALRVPTVLVRGGASQLVTLRSVQHFQSLQPGLIVTEVPGAGHMFTGDQNDVFADTLIEHLMRLPPPHGLQAPRLPGTDSPPHTKSP